MYLLNKSIKKTYQTNMNIKYLYSHYLIH